MGMVQHNSAMYAAIRHAAEQGVKYGFEACGMIVGWPEERVPDRFLPVPNTHPDPEKHFLMHPDHINEEGQKRFGARWKTAQPVSMFHSHPNGSIQPSSDDIEGFPVWMWDNTKLKPRGWIISFDECDVKYDSRSGRPRVVTPLRGSLVAYNHEGPIMTMTGAFL